MVVYVALRAVRSIDLRLRTDHCHLGWKGDDINKMTRGGLGRLFCVRLEYLF
jgi:hypothetical protein